MVSHGTGLCEAACGNTGKGPCVTSQASHKSQCPLFSIVCRGLHQSCLAGSCPCQDSSRLFACSEMHPEGWKRSAVTVECQGSGSNSPGLPQAPSHPCEQRLLQGDGWAPRNPQTAQQGHQAPDMSEGRGQSGVC